MADQLLKHLGGCDSDSDFSIAITLEGYVEILHGKTYQARSQPTSVGRAGQSCQVCMSEISHAGVETGRGKWLDVVKHCVDPYPICRRNDP